MGSRFQSALDLIDAACVNFAKTRSANSRTRSSDGAATPKSRDSRSDVSSCRCLRFGRGGLVIERSLPLCRLQPRACRSPARRFDILVVEAPDSNDKRSQRRSLTTSGLGKGDVHDDGSRRIDAIAPHDLCKTFRIEAHRHGSHIHVHRTLAFGESDATRSPGAPCRCPVTERRRSNAEIPPRAFVGRVESGSLLTMPERFRPLLFVLQPSVTHANCRGSKSIAFTASHPIASS